MQIKNFTLIQKKDLKEVDGVASLWEHSQTKAKILSVSNSDENKCFGVTFRTPPSNSTGVAHILEHSVLCGSKKYPVKEPFVELLKGSLNTFLNAFTFPDKTCYPVASANLKDFYNLIDVYLDAVFHPTISENIFKQEGWHIEADVPDGGWSYKGVVFNEMKGAYSSPDSVLAEQSQQALFPDTLYSLDSGGNPECIPNLTYEAFKNFHQTYYHPSNARFFFWGDDPEEKRFEIIENILQGYTYRAIHSEIPLQPHISTPIEKSVAYAAGSPEQKAMFTVSWLLAERSNISEVLKLEMLSHILEGMSGSPLQRALINSGLGEETTGCGLEGDLRQMYYSTGLKGIRQEDIPKAKKLIFDTLAELVEKGIPQSTINAAVNTVEFEYRERNTGRFPRGLSAMILALSTWLYDEDPLAALAWEAPLQDIKVRLAKGEKVFENCIKESFLDNTHRATVSLIPDLTLGAKRESAEKEKIHAIFSKASQDERKNYAYETKKLKEAQMQPDSPEALATIPSLSINDLPKENTVYPEEKIQDAITFMAHEQPTLGIAYASLLFPLQCIPKHCIPLLPFFLRSMTEIGTAKRDYIALGDAIASSTGGIQGSILLGTTHDTKELFQYFSIGGKAVYEKIDDLFELLEEILLYPLKDGDDLVLRIKQMLLEEKARLEEALQSAGHSFVSNRLSARYCSQGSLVEQIYGVTYINSLKNYITLIEENPEQILTDLDTLRTAILSQKDALCSATAESEGLAKIHTAAKTLLGKLPAHVPDTFAKTNIPPMTELPKNEVLLTPSQVNYVGKSVNCYSAGWEYNGRANVILRYLRMGYLWETVRVRGGAYGAFCSFDRALGTLKCISYRDPNTSETLEAYDNMALFLKNFTPDQVQLTQAIVGAVGDLDTYNLPSAKGSIALARTLSHDTKEKRQCMREQMLATTAKDFRDFADVVALLKDGDSCIVGGEDAKTFADEHSFASTKIL